MNMNESTSAQTELPSLTGRAILSAMAEGVIVSDIDGQVTLCNQAVARMLGVDPQAVLGQSVHALFEPCSAQCRSTVTEAMDRLCADPYTFGQSQESAERIEVNAQILLVRLSPLLTEIGQFTGIAIFLQDVTREVEAERTRDDFVSYASHEMRTPLTAIKGYGELLWHQVSGQLDAQQKRFLQVIQNNADRLVKLLDDMVNLSRLDSGQLELDVQPVHMETVIRDVAETIRSQCTQKGLRLVVDTEPKVGSVLGDKERLTQVVANLADNACRHTPKGGRITLSLSRVEGEIRVDVADTGVGIAPKDQAKIFQGFHRTGDSTASRARTPDLGLPLAKGLVERHGGRVWMESTPETGNTLSFALPLQIGAIDDGPAPRTEHPGPQRTVLVVEDDDDVAQLIALQLRQEGYQVLTTEWGEEALLLARTKNVDLITLDIMLPDIQGTEVLRRLKADTATASIPVVIVSVLKPKAVDGLGAAGHIAKPFTLDKLVFTIQRTLSTTP
jgi:PAS domain S-box-containing protein